MVNKIFSVSCLSRLRSAVYNVGQGRNRCRCRSFHSDSGRGTSSTASDKRTTMNYIIAVGVVTAGLSYAAVPLYRIFCQSTSYGGTVAIEEAGEKVKNMKVNPKKIISVRFNADIGSSMRWNFHPQQTEIQVTPGETALAFYTAVNPTDKAVVGVSTYNVVPFEAGQYFNKIQCFCFEEQLLNPREQVDMPVFFYIDPEFAEDPKMEYVNDITLSYTFFESKPGMNIPFMNHGRK